MIYLDNAATAYPFWGGDLHDHLWNSWANPSTVSTKGRQVRSMVENTRSKFANYIGANSEEIYFTSCGSESNNWAIKGFLSANDNCLSLIVSEVEHPSVYEVARYYKIKNELRVHYCPVDKDGIYRLEDLETILQTIKEKDNDDIPLVSMMYVNNETGVINDINAVANLVHKYGGVLHSDMVQALTHIPINVKELDIDMASFSFCKIGLPRGLGALYIKEGIAIDPLIHGGGQERGLRSGTENTMLISMLAETIDYCLEHQDFINECVNELNARLINEIISNSPVQVIKNGKNTIPNIISIRFKGIDASRLRDLLDIKDILVSTGSACKSGSNEPSRILKAMALSDKEAKETIRISFNSWLFEYDIKNFVHELIRCIKSLQMLEE